MGLKTSDQPFKVRLEESKKDLFMQDAVAKAQDAQWIKREGARAELGNWQEWRRIGEHIRQHVLDQLPHYLTEFSDNVAKQGGHVFFAKDAEEARDYVKKVIEAKNAKNIVKSKSMVTTEVGIDPMLVEMPGINVMETDLAEFILQMDDWDEPSHIVFPAIHLNRDQIKEIFAKKLGYDGDNEPVHLARFARDEMRKFFLNADIGITGCNFAVANTGKINLDTNEGNADLTISIPKTQIVLMGMERIVPTIKEAETMDNLLARSAVGQSLTTYVTFAGQKEPDEADGPEEFHVVIIDNGRSNALGTEFQPVLQCIRCGSCLNVCPVYRHIGGHGYGSIYPGPIGAILSPVLGGYEDFGDLPYASSLCAACDDTCPVRIPIHSLLIAHRKAMADQLKKPKTMSRFYFNVVGLGTSTPWLFKMATVMAHGGLTPLKGHGKIAVENMYDYGGFVDKGPYYLHGWTQVRDLPMPPKASERWRKWYKTHKAGEGK